MPVPLRSQPAQPLREAPAGEQGPRRRLRRPTARGAVARLGRAGSLARLDWRDLLLSMAAARLVVVAALLAAHSVRPPVETESLLGWDAEWYADIARHGYDELPDEAIRFFPLFPLLGRLLGAPLDWLGAGSWAGRMGGGDGVALLVLANAAALAYAAVVQHVARREGLAPVAVRAVPWVIAFAPAGFVLAMAYTEALYGVLVGATLLAARGRRWGAAALCGVLAGLLRPTGVLLCVPIAVEWWLAMRRGGDSGPTDRRLLAPAAALLSPLAGLVAFCAWCASTRGDALAAFREQTTADRRGAIMVNPVQTLQEAASAALNGDLAGSAALLHAVWSVLAVALLVVCARRLPVSYTLFAAATLVLALTSRGMSSFERYAGSALPLLLAAATLLTKPRRRRMALVLAAGVLAAYATAAFRHAYIP
jgi:hypothetical protein